MDNDWKKRLGVVYSTDPDFNYDKDNPEPEATLPPENQLLKVYTDRKGRKGKTVTIVSGFRGTQSDILELGKKIKKFCGTGGSVKEGEIIIQGDLADKIGAFLEKESFKVKSVRR